MVLYINIYKLILYYNIIYINYSRTRRAEIGRSYVPSGDRTFLLPPDDKYIQFSPTPCVTMNGHIRLNIILHISKQLHIILDQIHDYRW